MEPLVSILIPAFNAERWIADAIQSAIGQTWARKEIIVVDDGSTDQTPSIARQFESKGVAVVTQENRGAAAARNKAFSLSRGDFIQWLDADDLLGPDKIAKQIGQLPHCHSNRTLLAAAWGDFYNRVERARFSPTSLWTDLSPIEWLLRNLGEGVFLQTASWLVSRELTRAVGPWNARLLGDDDGEYFCRAVRLSDGILFVPHAKTFYRRVGSTGLSYVGLSNAKLDAHLLSMQLQIQNIQSLEDSERVRRACLVFMQRYMIYFYPERMDVIRKLDQLAAQVGGRLQLPRLSWKYAWIRKIFGWTVAKRAQLFYNQCKSSVARMWDRILYSVESPQRKLEVGH
jgi:glycosyltransferase involved in cell wall biosynthesis